MLGRFRSLSRFGAWQKAAVSHPSCPGYARVMLKWDNMSKRGRRGSDTGATLPPAPRRDLILETVIAQEQVDMMFQPLIEPHTGRVVGAEALARSQVETDTQILFARAAAGKLDERLS